MMLASLGFMAWRHYIHCRFVRCLRLCDRLAARLAALDQAGQLHERNSEVNHLLEQHEAALQEARRLAIR